MIEAKFYVIQMKNCMNFQTLMLVHSSLANCKNKKSHARGKTVLFLFLPAIRSPSEEAYTTFLLLFGWIRRQINKSTNKWNNKTEKIRK